MRSWNWLRTWLEWKWNFDGAKLCGRLHSQHGRLSRCVLYRLSYRSSASVVQRSTSYCCWLGDYAFWSRTFRLLEAPMYWREQAELHISSFRSFKNYEVSEEYQLWQHVLRFKHLYRTAPGSCVQWILRLSYKRRLLHVINKTAVSHVISLNAYHYSHYNSDLSCKKNTSSYKECHHQALWNEKTLLTEEVQTNSSSRALQAVLWIISTWRILQR